MPDDPTADRYQFLFEKSADPMLIIENGCFTECNQAALRMFGVKEKTEILNLHPSEISPEYQPDGQRSIDKAEAILARTPHEPYQRFEWAHLRPDGSVFPVEVALIAIPGDKGPIVHTSIRDITTRKQLETENRHFQKMDAVGKLAGGIAHDFNNHLVPIIGYAELLVKRLGDDPKAQKWAKEIHRAAHISAMMIGKILAVSRKEVGEASTVEINHEIGSLVDMLGALIGESISVEFEQEGRPLYARVSAGDIDQIVLNLATNARDSMPDGGVLTIRTSIENDSLVRVSVADTGTGMDEPTASRALEPFFTTKSIGTGTGLGLSTVYGIVTEAKGAIDISTAPGQGTTVVVRLPLEDAPGVVDQDADGMAEADPPRAAKRGHVLVVEDNEHVAKFADLVLTAQGYRVSTATDGRQGLDVFASEQPDVILSDVIMPVMSGPEMIEELISAGSAPPVVFMSGYTEDRLVTLGCDLSRMPVIGKPFSRTELLNAISGALRESEAAADS